MRGKIAFPFTRRGAELSTFGVPGGSGPEGDGVPGVTPGGTAGGSTNGEPDPDDELVEGVGVATAAVEEGHGSVLKEPRASARTPFLQRTTTRKRYVVAGSRPVRVVRAVRAVCATVVGDQIP